MEHHNDFQDIDYSDVRMELRNVGQNLTSVMTNPRESAMSFFEELWEEFNSDDSPAVNSAIHTMNLSSHSLESTTHSFGGPSDAYSCYSPSNIGDFRIIYQKRVEVRQNSDNFNLLSDSINTQFTQQAVPQSPHGVPDYFFHSSFALRDPVTFMNVITPTASEGEAQLNKLNDYLDSVENCLLGHIWVRSSAIFSALEDIKGQQEHVSKAIDRLLGLRAHLKVVDKKLAISAIHIPKMHQRKVNESLVQAKVVAMQHVMQGLGAIRDLMEMGEYLSAFELIRSSQNTSNTELKDIKCMAATNKQLDAYDVLVCELISNQFVSIAIQWDPSGDSIISEDSQKRLAGMTDWSGEEASSLKGLTRALLVIERVSSAFSMYKSRLIESIRLIVRTCISEYLQDVVKSGMNGVDGTDSDESSGSLFAERIKGMSSEVFLNCLLMCFDNLLEALERANRVNEFICHGDYSTDTVETQNNENGISETGKGAAESGGNDKEGLHEISAVELESMKKLSHTCVISACDIAQRAVTQLLSLKKNEMTRIGLEKMAVLWDKSAHFIDKIEEISGASAYIIRQSLHAQTSLFLSYTHERNKISLISTMDHEKWVQSSVPSEIQQGMTRLYKGRFGSSAGKGGVRDDISIPENAKDEALFLDGVKYHAVWSVLQLLSNLLSYLEIAIQFPSIAADILSMIKDLMSLFNKSSRMLVLGSGAQKSLAQLRAISAKNLTATAQSLAVLIAVLPHIRTVLMTQLPQNRSISLMELDRVSHDLVEHHGAILGKFVTILGDGLDSSSNKLRGFNWDQYHDKSDYFDDVLKNVAALHRVLIVEKGLPAEESNDIFSRVFSLLARRIPRHFEQIMPKSDSGKQRIVDEIMHLSNALSLLQGVNSASFDAIETAFKQKYLSNKE